MLRARYDHGGALGHHYGGGGEIMEVLWATIMGEEVRARYGHGGALGHPHGGGGESPLSTLAT